MKTYILEDGQKPSEETLKRLSELRDEDIVYDDDCPELTPKMEQALSRAVAEGKEGQELCYDDDPFYSEENQQYIKKSIEQLESGQGKIHDLMDGD